MLRLYRSLLRLLPASFREEFGPEMVRVVEEHWGEVRRERSVARAAGFWSRQVGAVLRAAVGLRLGGPGGPGTEPNGNGRDDGRWGTMDGLWQDLRHSVRSLRKHPGFTLVTVLTLGLGIGASTVVFSAVRTVLLRDLPYGDPDRIVAIFHENRETGERGNGVSAVNVRDLRENADNLSEVAVAEPWSMDLQVEGRAESLRAWAVTEGFFRTAGVEAVEGRTFLPEEHAQGAEPVALLSHGSWQSRFGADPSLVGSQLTLDGGPVTVVGVLPEAFRLPDAAELWIPRAFLDRDEQERTADYMIGIGRLAPGVTHEQAQAEVSRVAASLGELHPDTNARLDFRLVPLREHLFGDVRAPLLVLLGAVGFVLLIACVNVTGLVLARGAERSREYALRGALGASVARLTRHVTMESLLLAAGGCLLGLGLTHLGVELLHGLGADHLPRIDEIEVDGAVLAFAVSVGGLSALLAGLAPSLRLARPDLSQALNEGARGASGGRRGVSLRHRLVVLEVAAAMVLLVGAGLLFKSFSVLLDRELGFEPEGRLAVQVFAYDYEDGAARAAFVRQTLEEMEAIPGVARVALASTIPSANDEGALSSIDIDLAFTVEDRAPPPAGREPTVRINMVSAGYFETLEIPVLEGRGFTLADDGQAPRVVVVNEAFVRRHFGDEDPLGERVVIGFANPRPREIVGVVGDVRPGGFESEPGPLLYFPLTQQGTGSLTFLLAAEDGIEAGPLTRPAMEAVWRVNPAQSVWGAATLDALLGDWLKERRFNLVLLGSFALLALLLSGVGLYGLVSFSVEQRVAELGIRRALGGGAGSILAMILREGAVLALTGVALGTAGALVLGRFLRGMLFEVRPTDPSVFVLLGAAVVAVAALATLVPALRAVRADPMVALRSE